MGKKRHIHMIMPDWGIVAQLAIAKLFSKQHLDLSKG